MQKRTDCSIVSDIEIIGRLLIAGTTWGPNDVTDVVTAAGGALRYILGTRMGVASF